MTSSPRRPTVLRYGGPENSPRPMTKREFGALRQLPSGRWQAKYRHPRTNEFVVAPTTFAMKGDASRWLASVQRDIERGTWIDPEWGTVAFRDRDLLVGTAHAAASHGRAVPGTTGAVHLAELGEPNWAVSPRDVRSWHVALLKGGRPGPVTVAKAYRLLRTICETAVSDEMIARNPCNLKGAAVEHSPERPVLSVAEVEALVGAIDERFAALVLLGAWCGLRLGEALALAREDVDLEVGSSASTSRPPSSRAASASSARPRPRPASARSTYRRMRFQPCVPTSSVSPDRSPTIWSSFRT